MSPERGVVAACLATGIALLLFATGSVDACSCMPSHPQDQYCNADYVIVARVISRRALPQRFVYKIDIRKTYKMSEKAQHYLKHGRIFTSRSDSMCGIQLKLGELYMFAGNSNTVGLCNYVKEYSKMTIVEKRGVAGGFKKGCPCKIEPCFNTYGCSKPIGGCDWIPWRTCESDYGVCVPSRGFTTPDGRPTKCHWRRSKAYMQCLADP